VTTFENVAFALPGAPSRGRALRFAPCFRLVQLGLFAAHVLFQFCIDFLEKSGNKSRQTNRKFSAKATVCASHVPCILDTVAAIVSISHSSAVWRILEKSSSLRSTFRRIAMVTCRGKEIAPSSRDGTVRAPGHHAFKSAVGGTISPSETTTLGRSASSRPRHATTTRRPKRRCSTWRRARSETKRKGGHRNDPDERRNTYDEL